MTALLGRIRSLALNEITCRLSRHDQGVNLTFIDGHEGRWRWLWPKAFTGHYSQAVNTQGLVEEFKAP